MSEGQCSIGHCRFLNVVFPNGMYELFNRATDYIVPEVMLLPGLSIFIPERPQCNGGVLQGQKGIRLS